MFVARALHAGLGCLNLVEQDADIFYLTRYIYVDVNRPGAILSCASAHVV